MFSRAFQVTLVYTYVLEQLLRGHTESQANLLIEFPSISFFYSGLLVYVRGLNFRMAPGVLVAWNLALYRHLPLA